MPLGLWKGKWEIHREDVGRFWTEMDRRHEESEGRFAEINRRFDQRDGSPPA